MPDMDRIVPLKRHGGQAGRAVMGDDMPLRGRLQPHAASARLTWRRRGSLLPFILGLLVAGAAQASDTSANGAVSGRTCAEPRERGELPLPCLALQPSPPLQLIISKEAGLRGLAITFDPSPAVDTDTRHLTPAQLRQLIMMPKTPWIIGENDRFRIFARTNPAQLTAFMTELESYRLGLEALASGSVADEVQPLDIYLVPNAAGTSVAGFMSGGFYSATTRARFAIATWPPRLPPDNQAPNNRAVFHEYAHYFMLNRFPARYPGWVVEGFATYVETATIEGSVVRFGEPPPRMSAASHRWLPWKAVLTKKVHEFPGEDWSTYYYQTWLLTRYMISDDHRRRLYNDYLVKVAGGAASDKTLYDLLGIGEAQLTTAITAPSSSIPIVTLPLKDRNRAGAMKIRSLPKSAGDLLLRDLRTRRHVATSDQSAFVSSVRAKASAYERDVYRDRVLARTEALYGDAATALHLLKALISTSPRDPELRLLAAEAHRRQSVTASTDPAKAALIKRQLDNLEAAVRLAPSRYEYLYALAQALKEAGDRGRARRADLLARALQLAPDVDEIRRELAVTVGGMEDTPSASR